MAGGAARYWGFIDIFKYASVFSIIRAFTAVSMFHR
jgi:hypothetical protein